MSPFRSSRDHADLERRLRAGAVAFGSRVPADLRGRILARLSEVPAPEAPAASRGAERWGSWIAAAAAALVLCSAWWLTHRSEAREERSEAMVALSRELLDAGTRVLALPGEVEGNLRLEAEKLLADTTRVAEGVVRGLPAPLRARLERL
jgi:hypothetical protein